jgi:hypothetical protein
MLSGLIVSTGAAALFSFVVEAASPADAATRFPEQPKSAVDKARTMMDADRARTITRSDIPHLSVW